MFLFIAYKPNSNDYCRGCHMASYNSDFYSVLFETAAELKMIWADYLVSNERLRVNEAGFRFQVFKDGIPAYDSTGELSLYRDEELGDAQVWGDAQNEVGAIFEEATVEAKVILERLKAEKAHKEELAKAAEVAAALETKKRMFEALKAELEPRRESL